MNKLNKTAIDLDLSDDELISQIAELPEEERAMFMASLSDEEREEFERRNEVIKEGRSALLESLGQAVSEMRAEAIKARSGLGIEEEWTEDEEFYEGVDDANRGDSKTWSSKPPGRTEGDEDDETSSNIFLNITGPYCDAAGASLADMLLPTDDSAWQLTHTPFPEMIPFAEGNIPTHVRKAVQKESQTGNPFNQTMAAKQAEETEARLIEDAKDMIERAKQKAEKAQRRIED
ncbi:MAG: hypothetical protein KDA17_06040, partial [Candidatus Saccharibacteria bacterium]|nr:hypothetical protein [Candidatus Saccharibacteria bacterium]